MLKSTKIILAFVVITSILFLAASFILISEDSEFFALPLLGFSFLFAVYMYALDRDLKIRYGTGLGSGLGDTLRQP